MLNQASQRGFTLVEIAMVLVIVALIMGGVMRGQELVTQARIRDIMNDLNGVTAAYHFYYDRYRAVPGDDANAATRWVSYSAKAGGGDGVISGKYMDAAPLDPTAGGFTVDNTQNEGLAFWWHLRMAGFVGGPATGAGAATQPSNSVGGILGVQSTGLNLSTLIVCESNIPDKISAAVDTQLDDQRPNSGQVRAYQQSSSNEDVMGKAPNVTAYQETGSTQYVVCKTI
jgi:prepilin-type N-terminal cleavage/methylation domain-containing protein